MKLPDSAKTPILASLTKLQPYSLRYHGYLGIPSCPSISRSRAQISEMNAILTIPCIKFEESVILVHLISESAEGNDRICILSGN